MENHHGQLANSTEELIYSIEMKTKIPNSNIMIHESYDELTVGVCFSILYSAYTQCTCVYRIFL